MADHAHNLVTRFPTTGKPVGVITRGTTNPNRLRKCDRWMIHDPQILAALHRANHPRAVDVGYGASHTTTCEWATRLRTVCPTIAVTGLEINPEHILPERDGVQFQLGGFELAGLSPHLVRAFNVLRQYDVSQVHQAWEVVTTNMAPGGIFVEGTCDELGRRSTWITITADTGPLSLTLACTPGDWEKPSDIAERLPKVLIHNNTPGHKIHDVLTLLDEAWKTAAPFSVYGPRVRWRETRKIAATTYGLPLDRQRRPLTDNRITLPWDCVSN